MSKQCKDCAFWSGDDSNFSANCTQHNQNTTFDFTCTLFSQRAKPKNHNAERGLAQPYYTKDDLVKAIADIEWTQVRNDLGLNGRLIRSVTCDIECGFMQETITIHNTLKDYQEVLREWTRKNFCPSVLSKEALEELGIDIGAV